MKSDFPALRIFAFAFFAAFALLCGAEDTGESAEDLDFGTDIETPKVPEKVAPDIRTHMKSIANALGKHQLEVTTERDDEVVNIKIPCSVFFAPNDTVLKPGGAERLRLLADVLKYPTMYKVIVAVYSDDTGDDEYNDNLTMTRANAIDEYLIGLAPADKEVNVVPYGMGSADPRVENNSIANRALNRRVEILIVPEWQMIETARAGKLKSKKR